MSLLRSRILTVTVPLVVVGAAVFVTACSNTSSYTHYNSDGSTLPLGDPPAQICKNPPVSPYNYRYAGSSDTEVAYVSGTQGLPTYGSRGTDFPNATKGFIIPTGGGEGSSTSNGSVIWAKEAAVADAVYWFAAGTHYSPNAIVANDNDVLVGAPGAVIDGTHKGGGVLGPGTAVTIEYLTFDSIGIPVDGQGWAALNFDESARWTMDDLVVQGTGDAAINTGPQNIVKDDCLTHNGQAGIIGYSGYGTVIESNEVSFNDPPNGGEIDYDNSKIKCGCAAGIKLLNDTDDTISGNYVHDNGDAGIWLDTNDAGITITDNYISDNPAIGIDYEASYDGLIRNNVLVGNGIASNAAVKANGNPAGAIYIQDSGSLPSSTGLKATPYCLIARSCPASTTITCGGSIACQVQFLVVNNSFVDNWDGIIVYSDDTRNVAYCPSGTPRPGSCAETTTSGHVGTLVGGTIWRENKEDPEGIIHCYNAQGRAAGGTPNYWDACIWPTMGVLVTNNLFSMNPAAVDSMTASGSPQCTIANLCGINGLYAFPGGCCETGNYNPGTGYQPPGCPDESNPPFVCGLSRDADISYNWDNRFSDNGYYGPWWFWAWDQTDQSLPYSWSKWTGQLSRCSSQNSDCDSNFGQDQGSTVADSGGPAWNFTG
jgi:parallel beta-helix repeat protein